MNKCAKCQKESAITHWNHQYGYHFCEECMKQYPDTVGCNHNWHLYGQNLNTERKQVFNFICSECGEFKSITK